MVISVMVMIGSLEPILPGTAAVVAPLFLIRREQIHIYLKKPKRSFDGKAKIQNRTSHSLQIHIRLSEENLCAYL